MLNSEIEQLSSKFPAGFKRDWDAHIYYEPSQRAQAAALRDRAFAAFHNDAIVICELRDELVGPHPLAMFEINFAQAYFSNVVCWLMQAREGLDVLVHQVTGDDPVDHYAGALWLGQTLLLDDSKLDPSP